MNPTKEMIEAAAKAIAAEGYRRGAAAIQGHGALNGPEWHEALATAALTAALSVQWRGMEGAPKDRPILLWLRKKIDRNHTVTDLCDFTCIGFWQHGRWVSIEVQDCGSMGGEYTGWMEDWCPLDVEPIAWMPLPPPPASKE